MPRRFFDLSDDLYIPHRWHLDTPVNSQGHTVHDWDFTRGMPVRGVKRLKIPVEVAGRPLDFCFAGSSVPVVHVKVASILAEHAPGDMQFIPADISGHPDQYLVLVATRLIRCIDEEASEVSFWTPEHGVPEKIGQYMGVDRMRINKVKAGNANIFRPEGWTTALIVSEELKEALEQMGATGTRFEEV